MPVHPVIDLTDGPSPHHPNIAHACVDRHVLDGHGDDAALRVVDGSGRAATVTYDELATASSRFANVLRELGVRRGDVVAVLLPSSVDAIVAVLGALKHRCAVAPLFTSFGPEPLRLRLHLSDARVLVTTPDAAATKVADIRGRLPHLDHVLVTGTPHRTGAGPTTDTWSLPHLLARTTDRYGIGRTAPHDPALLHFTGGTTGTPKAVVHPHAMLRTVVSSAHQALGLHGSDVLWCTADPGWITWTSYAVLAPLAVGATTVVDEADGVRPARWYRLLGDERVTVWYTSPTAVRRLRQAGPDEPGAAVARPHLRHAATVGEPLDPATVAWAEHALGIELHDTWWQTETGAILVANPPGVPVVPGAMGVPLPGVGTALVRVDGDGRPLLRPDGSLILLDGPNEGMLAVAAGWASMFQGYLLDDARYRRSFAVGDGTEWYLTGDLVRRDGAGVLWFLARSDDVLQVAGHLVGPVEVERVLEEHPAVAEAGVFGVPDTVAGESIHAVVVLAPGVADGPEVRDAVMAYARARLGPLVCPETIGVLHDLPRSRSSKLLRRVLTDAHDPYRPAVAPAVPPHTT